MDSKNTSDQPSTDTSRVLQGDNNTRDNDIIERIDSELKVLQLSAEEQELLCALKILVGLIADVQAKAIQFLEDNQVHIRILAVLRHQNGSSQIQQAGLHVLCRLCEKRLKTVEEMVDCKMHIFLIQLLQDFSTDDKVQECGISLLGYMLESEVEKNKLMLECQQSSMLDLICHDIIKFPANKQIQVAAARVVSCLMDGVTGQEVRHYLMNTVCNSVIESLHAEVETVAQIHTLSAIIGDEDKYRLPLVEKDVHCTLMELCSKYPKDQQLMTEATNLLLLLSKEDSVQLAMTTNRFVQNGLVVVMDSLRLSEKVQRTGLEMITILVPNLLKSETNADEISHTIIKTVYTAMFAHGKHTTVQVAGCHTLSVLLEYFPEANKWIGENSEDKQYPVHNLVVKALLAFNKDVVVYEAACDTLFWIAADNERLCEFLMGKNIHNDIINGLKMYKTQALAVETGTRALMGLCIFFDSHKLTVVKDGAFAVLSELQQLHLDIVSVQKELISLIACLADIDFIRHQCFIESIHDKIIACMKSYKGESMIQETCLEAFAVLAGAEGGQEILVKAGALTTTLDALVLYAYSDLIIKKGLIVLQLFSSQTNYFNEEIRNKITYIIHTALRDFPTNKGVQTEAYVALQLLAEDDEIISKLFVECGCHEYLFEILELGTDTALQEIASECLFVLSQEQNLKSEMLLSACRNGMLPATKCLLELGADINIGENDATPLCLAVKNKHINLVRLLLKQGVQDLRTPLRLSIALELHSITGLILEQIGYNGEVDGITWSKLQLEKLESTWIIEAFTIKADPLSDADSVGRVYIEKIKEGEQKRKQRKCKIVYSKSDSSLRKPRVRIRHKIVYEQSSEIMSDDDKMQRVPRSSIAGPAPTWPKVQPITRSLSVPSADENSVDFTVYKIEPVLPVILSNSPADEKDLIEDDSFNDLTPVEEEEWKQTTLSGAGIVYHSKDPRLQRTTTMFRTSSELGFWVRKRSRSPVFNNSASSNGPHQLNRKMSAPVLCELEHLPPPRRHSIEFVTGTENDQASQVKIIISIDVSTNAIQDVSALASSDLKGCLANLSKLELTENRITFLPTGLNKTMPNITSIDGSRNRLESFPDDILLCPKLDQLLLGYNQIKDLHGKNTTTTLTILDLCNNQLKELPNNLGNQLPNLQELNLSHNMLISLPQTSLDMKQLQKLDLSLNFIQCLPNEFLSTCSLLESLDISYNNLIVLPDQSLSACLPKLSKLKLKRNSLSEKSPFYIPRFILELPCLRSLDISENELTGLPSLSMWHSKVMKDFNASNNLISVLDLQDAKVWAKLERLNLSKNNLSKLPREIGHLSCLTSLDISGNKGITTLPDELGKCSKIYEMPMGELELDLNKAVLKRRVKDIINYLNNRLKKSKRYYRMKLMVVGYGGKGKTTLLKTLMKEKFEKKENRPTVGVVVKDWTYNHLDRRGSFEESQNWRFGQGKNYTLNTWDFAGQEEFYSSHCCYLSNRAIYLVVFDLRGGVSECKQLKSWLVSIRSRAPGCPVIVVGTHLDKLPKESKGDKEIFRISDALRDFNIKPGFPTINEVHFVNASCENECIEKLRTSIKSVVDSFEIGGKRVMGEKIPTSYVMLADALTEMAKPNKDFYPVLHHRDLLQLVQDKKLELDEDELQQAIRFLHESGIILHYDDASLHLKDYYFIDPGWLCRMMAQVVTVRQINPFVNNDGILLKENIYMLFKDNNVFPKKLVPQYITLLEKFEIALQHSDKELLIPCNLLKTKPSLLAHFHTHARIKRQYRMPYIPIGLIFRMMARLISMTTNVIVQSVMKIPPTYKRILWQKGIYIYWSEKEYFLVESSSEVDVDGNEKESINIYVPTSPQGVRLLGQIVDSLDSLIDEWYPGLTSIDPIMGQEILEKLVPCPQCLGEPHRFTISELQAAASQSDFIRCTRHHADVLLTELAPDLVLGDLEFELKLDTHLLQFTESSENQLGDGGYGNVFHAIYKNQEVAVKLFKKIADIHPLTMLRQEATILRCLNHPSVVSLLAVGIQPPVLVIELAPLGTLGDMIKANKEHARPLQHKIACQVAEGLDYLHSIMIIYRDMKPDNVLIFSTSLEELVNAKIADYGIARFTTLQGLQAQEGTLGYRAPEVIRKESYSFKADVFSYGLTLYVMLTGRHPLADMDSNGEKDRAIAEGVHLLPPETKISSHDWPNMSQLVKNCLCYDPDLRPSSKEILRDLSQPDALGLQRIIPVSRSTTVECLAMEETTRKDTRLWIASGDSETTQLSYMHLNDNTSRTTGVLFKHGRIMCMQVLVSHRLAIGTQGGLLGGKVWIFDTYHNTIMHSSALLQDAVLCMKYLKWKKEGGYVLVGLANGEVSLFTLNELLQDKNAKRMCIYQAEDHAPVICMQKIHHRVFVSCGTRILTINTENSMVIEELINAQEKGCNIISQPINAMAVLPGLIIFSRKSKTEVTIWNELRAKVEKILQIADLFQISQVEARVSALSADNKFLWIGTRGGYIGIVDLKTFTLQTKMQGHTSAVRCLVHMPLKGSNKCNTVFSGGLGCKELRNEHMAGGLMYGCVLSWDVNLPQHSISFAEHEQKRKELRKEKSGS